MASQMHVARPGAAATKPSEIPASGWRQVLVRAWKEAGTENISLISAGVAFYAFLAFVPLLAALVLTYGLVAEPSSVVRHMQALTSVMPGEAAALIGEQMKSVVTSAGSKKGFGLLLALLLALYGATKGATSIMTALNIVNDAEESRGFVRRTLLALAITAGAVASLLVAILAISMLGFVDRLLPTAAPFVHTLLRIAFWLAAAAAVSALIAAVYRYGPDRPRAKWRWISPGSAAATVVWVIATMGFGFYVANFGNYNATYGSLGAVIVFLTWLYLSAYILLMGAEINAEAERQTAARTSVQGGREVARDRNAPPFPLVGSGTRSMAMDRNKEEEGRAASFGGRESGLGGGDSGGGAYPNPHSGKKPEKSGFMGRGGQTEMEYHGEGQLGEDSVGGNENAPAGGKSDPDEEDRTD